MNINVNIIFIIVALFLIDNAHSINPNQDATMTDKISIELNRINGISGSINTYIIKVTIRNNSDSIVDFYKNSLLGFRIYSKENTYNLNSRYDFVPQNKIEIKPSENYDIKIDLAKLWFDRKPLLNAEYIVQLKFEVEKDIYQSNELIVILEPEE